MFGEDDPVSVLSSQVILGQWGPCGSVPLIYTKYCLLRLQIREGSKEEVTTDSKFAPKLYLCHTGIGDGD